MPSYHQYVRDVAYAVHHALRSPVDGDTDEPSIILPTIHARIASSERWTTLAGARETLGRPLPWCEHAARKAAHAALTRDITAVVYNLVGE